MDSDEHEIPSTTAVVPTPRLLALDEIGRTTLAALVVRIDGEAASDTSQKNSRIFIFNAVFQGVFGASKFLEDGSFLGGILLASAVIQFALIAHTSIASRRARRDALPELRPEDADHLFRVVNEARKAILAPAARSAAFASLTPRRDILMREVERRLGLPASSLHE
jgi:hypothetical protein